MFKPTFLFLTIVLFASAADVIQELMDMHIQDGPTCVKEQYKLIECVAPHETLINHTVSTFQPDTLYNIGFMRKGIQISKNVSECLGTDLKCDFPRFVVFTLDTMGFVGKKVYGDAFHCFINAKTIDTIQHIPPPPTSVDASGNHTIMNDLSIFQEFKNSATEFVARKLYPTPSCTIGRIVDLYKAGIAALDWCYVAYKLQWGYPVEVEQFDAQKYCDN